MMKYLNLFFENACLTSGFFSFFQECWTDDWLTEGIEWIEICSYLHLHLLLTIEKKFREKVPNTRGGTNKTIRGFKIRPTCENNYRKPNALQHCVSVLRLWYFFLIFKFKQIRKTFITIINYDGNFNNARPGQAKSGRQAIPCHPLSAFSERTL